MLLKLGKRSLGRYCSERGLLLLKYCVNSGASMGGGGGVKGEDSGDPC